MTHTRFLLITVAACTALAATTASAASDRAFLAKAMKGDNSEMKLGEIAAQKGASPGVRDFGNMLHTDHAKAKAEVVPVARAHGVAMTDEMVPEAKAEKVKLDGLSGAAFDHEFASYMMNDHQKDIADFDKQTKIGDPATAKLAREQLPTLHKHLSVAEGLAK